MPTPVLLGTASRTDDVESLAATLTVGAAAGDTIVAVFHLRTNAGTNGSYACSDDSGNSNVWSEQTINTFSGTAQRVGVYFHHIVANGLDIGDVVTVTWTSSQEILSATLQVFAIPDVTQLDPLSGPADPPGAAGSSTTPSSGNYTSTADDTIVIGVLSSEDPDTVITEDGDFTTLNAIETNEVGDASDHISHIAYRNNTATETNAYAPTKDTATFWRAAAVVYEVSVAGGTILPQMMQHGLYAGQHG